MNRLQAINRLDFDYQRITDEQIHAESIAQREAFVLQWNGHLSLHRDVAQPQFPFKRQFVG